MSETEKLLEDDKDDVELESAYNINNIDNNNMHFEVKSRSLRLVYFLTKIVIKIIFNFWKLCTSSVLMMLLLCWAYGGVIPIIILISAVLGILYSMQDYLLYYPEQPPSARLYVDMPSLMNMPYESHFVKTKDGERINMVLVKHNQTTAPTVIFFHGNAGNIGHRLPNTYGLYSGCGCNVLLVEYRGYGRSEGTPSESGLYLDAEAAMDFILQRTDIDRNKIFLFGRSLGGAVSIHLAANTYYSQYLAGLILENTFTSLPDIGRKLFDFKILDLLPEWCFKNKYPSKIKIQKIKIPTLFLSGQMDSLIPPRMMQILHSLSPSHQKKIVHFPDGTHNETWTCPGYYESIARFIIEILSSRIQESFPETNPNSSKLNHIIS
ncbi:hypothetical protein ScPMuIL_007711 [Solemya velum]